ncbi:hypothetical protein [Oceanicaulis sp. MMSF_3324]|uniref:hypothetical protein n=1 Tax=Oceanicaulis sp. MMSF_3324 TaxID=3046702 RepID=UPI00273E56B9|nr:hypothetical protein [Oceanicaulis sp. MMSF_3324]
MKHDTSSAGLLGLCLAALCLLAIGWTLHAGPASADSLYLASDSFHTAANNTVSD